MLNELNNVSNNGLFDFVAFCSSGLEGAVALELKKFGYKVYYSSSGRIFFKARVEDIPFLNLYMKTADRISLLIKRFKAETFDELFDNVKSSNLSELVEKNAKIVVDKLKITNSKLSATGAVASVLKKAIVENLGGTNESGPVYSFVLVLKDDEAFLLLDTSGDALSKRGYRLKTSKAPLRETIAAAIVVLSRWDFESSAPLFDTFCGSGTIPIEAATLNLPNISRRYISEEWKILKEHWEKVKKRSLGELKQLSKKLTQAFIHGSDIDCQAIKVAQENMKRASQIFQTKLPIKFSCTDFRDLATFNGKAWIISNLPYGERLDDKNVIEGVKILREKFPNGNFYLLHADKDFEKLFGKARKKIRFQNSGIWTYLFMYY
ncbi:RNA methyltransferase [Fervidobacterium islandicum]|uniref:RNA methyltransferase n=1 Tax=Fervidobacterium islandicum TaxID=2423 RepID=A0AAI8GDE3_FERIS|nr:RNA methyltransferase [Fervidobacterium islandicum]AMW32922.2 RNA methyltransferase [Fervidobacterium islandicum]